MIGSTRWNLPSAALSMAPSALIASLVLRCFLRSGPLGIGALLLLDRCAEGCTTPMGDLRVDMDSPDRPAPDSRADTASTFPACRAHSSGSGSSVPLLVACAAACLAPEAETCRSGGSPPALFLCLTGTCRNDRLWVCRAPCFHRAHPLCARPQPGFLVHVFFLSLPFVHT
jgi:hypothetical protein